MFRIRYTLLLLLTISTLTTWSQAISAEYVARLNKTLPHHFKEIRTGATIEAVRTQEIVKIYVLVDDIEQYDEVLIERSDELGTNFSQCKLIKVIKGKYPNNYIELTDRYPVSSRMTNVYRVKTITSENIMRMYAPVPITMGPAVGTVKK